MQAILLGILIIAISGCTTVHVYQDPLSQLAEATQQTRSAIIQLSRETNTLARKNLAIEAAKQSQRFGNQELALVVSDNYLRFRSDGLALIELLTTRLLSVVNMNEGQQAAESLENLGASVESFANAHNQGDLARYAGPTANLAATVTRLYDSHVREEILQQAVEGGIPPARAILSEIKKDFDSKSTTNITNALREELSLNKAEKIDSYNRILINEKNLSESEKTQSKRIADRYQAILEIIIAEEALSAIKGHEVINALNALEKALDELQIAAKSGFKSNDFARAAQEINEFSRRAQELLMSIRSIREVRAN